MWAIPTLMDTASFMSTTSSHCFSPSVLFGHEHNHPHFSPKRLLARQCRHADNESPGRVLQLGYLSYRRPAIENESPIWTTRNTSIPHSVQLGSEKGSKARLSSRNMAHRDGESPAVDCLPQQTDTHPAWVSATATIRPPAASMNGWREGFESIVPALAF